MNYDKRLLFLELRSVECPGIGNYKRDRIFGGISHTSNVVALQTLELLEGWKFWRWEISEVSLYPKMKEDHLYGGTDTHGWFAIYFFNPCFRVRGQVSSKKYLYLNTGIKFCMGHRLCGFRSPYKIPAHRQYSIQTFNACVQVLY